jgi:hypothetical protein
MRGIEELIVVLMMVLGVEVGIETQGKLVESRAFVYSRSIIENATSIRVT